MVMDEMRAFLQLKALNKLSQKPVEEKKCSEQENVR